MMGVSNETGRIGMSVILLATAAALFANYAESFAVTPEEAVRWIEQQRGKIRRDAEGRVIAVDLASGRNAVDDETLVMLGTLKHLRAVKAAGAGITNKGVADLSRFENLEDLTLSGSSADAKGIRLLARLPKLKALDLRDSPSINDGTLEAIAAIAHLERLGLVGTAVTSQGVRRLAGLKNLQLLDLRECLQVGDDALPPLAKLPRLKVLRIGEYGITDESLKKLADFPALKELAVEKALITDEGLARLNRLPIESLSLFRCLTVTDAGLVHIGKISRLRSLSLRDTSITSKGLAHLRDLKNLQTLDLRDTAVDDAAVPHILALGKLSRLSAARTLISDEGVEALEKSGRIREFDLRKGAVRGRAGEDPTELGKSANIKVVQGERCFFNFALLSVLATNSRMPSAWPSNLSIPSSSISCRQSSCSRGKPASTWASIESSIHWGKAEWDRCFTHGTRSRPRGGREGPAIKQVDARSRGHLFIRWILKERK